MDAVAPAGLAATAPGVAFVAPLTPCERAWADLCDGRENADVERIVTATGGWDAWGAPVTYRAFTAAFHGDCGPLLAEMAAADGG
jgi:hypothetical protein